MDRLKKRIVMLFGLLSLVLFGSFLAAQGPPNLCANLCWQAYLNAVRDCHGDAACLAEARTEAEACIQGCNLLPPH